MNRMRTRALLVGCVLLLAGACGASPDDVVQSGGGAQEPSAPEASVASTQADAGTTDPAGDALLFRETLLGPELGRFGPPPDDAAELMPLSDVVVRGTVISADIQPTPEGASGATADDDAAELWLTLEVEVSDSLGPAISAGDTLTWAFVGWMGDPDLSESEQQRLTPAAEAAVGLEVTAFLHRSSAVDGWWSHASGAGAILNDGSVIATLDRTITVGSGSPWERPDEVWANADASLDLLGTRPEYPGAPE